LIRHLHPVGLWAGGALLVFVASTTLAGSGFIANSQVSDVESGDGTSAEIRVQFNCKAEYLRHEPQTGGDRLRIYLDPTGICNGVSPLVAESRSRLRPFNSDKARLVELVYDGTTSAGAVLTLTFSEPVTFDVDMANIAFDVAVRVGPSAASVLPATVENATPRTSRQKITQADEQTTDWAINLASFRRIPTIADAPALQLDVGQRFYHTEVIIDGNTWYRLRMGNFESADAASNALVYVRPTYPGAWIDHVDSRNIHVDMRVGKLDTSPTTDQQDVSDPGSMSKVDALMEEARKTMIAGDTSRAIQIYTKVLQLPPHPRQPEAQEYLALAREKKGQTAHAKAEYQRYLSLYPDSEGAARVNQRLAALLANNRNSSKIAVALGTPGVSRDSSPSSWRVQTYFSQYYRRGANQQNDQEEIVSQSALYSDVNLDARRRGDRFDFSSRISSGYRNNFLETETGSDDALRVSYAYADLADAITGLRARIGRQSRSTGGVLGRFDGLNLGFELNEQILFNAVYGMPAYSSSNSIDTARTFYGTSVNYRPPLAGLELGMFYIQQDIEGVDDRQAVGGEFRFFGDNQSLWGLVDYDTSYNELGSALLQGSWRFASRLSIHGSYNRRHSPFLSAGNALIGQPVRAFSDLLELYPVEEIRQFGLDRSPFSTTYTLGLSHSLTPKLQINANLNQSTIEATPESGGVQATPGSTYSYFSGSVVASSLLKEGDVSIVTARYSDSGTARVMSLSLDSRFPIGRTWRINPRLRVDRRQRLANDSYEWLYTPAIRIQYRRSQKLRIEFEAGKQYSQQDLAGVDLGRESSFINLGYQAFF
jgi:tetratricopeptide (TPR) repeat protein